MELHDKARNYIVFPMKPHCLLPWFGRFYGLNRKMTPCCAFKSEKSEYKELSDKALIESVRSNFLQGIVPEGCKNCQEKEQQLGRSLRLNFEKNLSYQRRIEPARMRPLDQIEYSNLKDVFPTLHLELSNSSTCNLRCRFCGPHVSSKWEKEYQPLAMQNPKIFSKFKKQIFSSITDEELLDIVENNSMIYSLEFRGGEPFLNPQMRSTLEKVRRTKKAKFVTLDITTNGTNIPDWFLDLASDFREIGITISIEATGKLYKYLRGEKYSLETDIYEQIKKLDDLDNLDLIFHCLISAFNIFEIKKVYEWIQTCNWKSFYKWQLGLLNSPKELSIYNLPLSFRQKAASLVEDEDDENLKLAWKLLAKQTHGASSLNGFKEYATAVDKGRGTSFLDVCDQYREIW